MATDVATTLDAALEPLIRQLAALPHAQPHPVVRAAAEEGHAPRTGITLTPDVYLPIPRRRLPRRPAG